MKNTYAFIAGNHPALSAAEIASRWPQAKISTTGEVIFVASKAAIEIEPRALETLGGSTKLIRVLTGGKKPSPQELLKYIPRGTGKIQLGISVYPETVKEIKTLPLGLSIKKLLKEAGHSVRVVTAKTANLSSVVVEKNHLLTDGIELVLIKNGETWCVGQTIAVQNFESYGHRDYGRPARDDRSGMLPPKLAQIMINLSGTAAAEKTGATNENASAKTLLDPFCGSGTILQEAALMGWKDIIGSDISDKAVSDSKANIAWLKQQYNAPQSAHIQLLAAPVEKLGQQLRQQSIDAMVFEGNLGPPSPTEKQVQSALPQLTTLYVKTFAVCEQLIKTHGTIVAALPSWQFPSRAITLPLEKIIPVSLKQKTFPGQTARKTFLYGRPQSTVYREIFVLIKIL
ncbi:MAG: hypothetical protein A3F54_03990 [Candidatus Kerfeldbacteria bacterium RIFCSPHIGHO2_12_FULL_48_17]|uniref:Methyltransferase domain-containing protein n=1 Tax=Candidatus Kerfeldbacteria bacterium RIFCSPHIGHO2_12_FULL_48_17 TaxID=1798542 RepID=A0A1G2B573_9BACT|nr:MAG: hypothetical protein A3F54_03990 [Candidatus Kerfeldbacteria bacterium RIFCSPHIGHO2_12_FULL_48_17]